MEDKKEKRPATLTELAERDKYLSEVLSQHTRARNLLWGIVSGDYTVPTILQITPSIKIDDASGPVAMIDLQQLTQPALEVILSTLIEHEEKLAFEAWKQILANAKQASKLIEDMQAARQKELDAQTKAQIIPLTQPETFDEPQELPQGWPGRVTPRISDN